MRQLSATQLAEWLKAATSCSADDGADGSRRRPLLLDVREPWEYELCHLSASLLIPMQTLPARLEELSPEADIVVICHHGVRSRQVGSFLESRGFSSVFNLVGGVDAWADDVDPTMRKY